MPKGLEMICLHMYNPQLKESCKYDQSSISSRLIFVLQKLHWRRISDCHHEFVAVWSAAFDLYAKMRHEVEQQPHGRLCVVRGTGDLRQVGRSPGANSISTAVVRRDITSKPAPYPVLP